MPSSTHLEYILVVVRLDKLKLARGQLQDHWPCPSKTLQGFHLAH